MKVLTGLTRQTTLTAGSVLVVGGVLDQLLLFDPDSTSQTVLSPWYAARSLILLGGGLLLLLALIALYMRRARQIGPFGFSAAIVAGAGTVLLSGLYWSQAFLYPTLGRVAAGLLDGADRPGSFAFGLLLTAAVFGVGWFLVGIAILRAHVYRLVPALVIMLGGLLSLIPATALGQAVLGAGLVLLAFSPDYRRHEGPQRH